ncbi:hypothetical protein WJX84_003860 [Apatococcus fuscideae]|uniref:TLC domain-containing protein n=1 Tax=Apatococcus fuscideae TaxID=2026836 RepID=A0AAW1TAL4_9CHLO
MMDGTKLSEFWTPSKGFDLFATVGLVFVFPLLRALLTDGVFQPASFKLLVSAEGRKNGKVSKKTYDTLEKFQESAWKFVVYTALFTLGLSALWDKSWMRDTSELWRGWPNQEFSFGVKSYYCTELGFYIASIGMLIFWEVRRRDFAAMMIHHLATVSLIVGSYYLNYLRVGSVIMLLHDASDILMELAKMMQYLKAETASVVTFAAFMISWVVLRLGILPFIIIPSAWWESPKVIGHFPMAGEWLVGLLVLLVCIHVYWFSIIVQIAYRKVMTGVTEDVRESEVKEATHQDLAPMHDKTS